jgi:hypothetical protein
VTTDNSLFPKPMSKIKKMGLFDEGMKLFNLIGYVVARGLYDDRLLDIPISSLFWDLVLKRVSLFY